MATELNEAQIEAIAIADAHTQNAALPTYTQLVQALNDLTVHVLHGGLDEEVVRANASSAQELVCRAF